MKLQGLHQVALRAADLDASVAFYRDVLGADFIARFDPPGLAFFALGGPDGDGVRLMLEGNAPPGTVYFRVDDIDAVVAELAAKGVTFDSGPALIHRDDDGTFGPPGGEEWMAFFKDPGGNTIALAVRKPPAGVRLTDAPGVYRRRVSAFSPFFLRFWFRNAAKVV